MCGPSDGAVGPASLPLLALGELVKRLEASLDAWMEAVDHLASSN